MSEAFKLAPHEWALLRSLLDEALALPPARRAAWLEALDDARSAGLKPRLRALLANAADAGDSAPATAARLLDTLPKVETGQFAPLPGAAAERAGDTAGPYRLIRELGSGGMGSVWLAERTDMLKGRQVALKLPHGAWKRAGLAERMAREREILATLAHPNIARLYDAGLAADGQPWLALEYVRGKRIDEVCRTASLPLRVRLHLFLQVAHAVAHAHAHLVVHRDLKPANILVTAEGSVKLLDFGIAKLVQEAVPEGEAGGVPETDLTRESGRVLTPEYASPEQILGQPIGTASDVYSLGVVLFELLSDVRPYQLARRSRGALEEAIVAADVPRPSTVAPPERRQALRGDLDTIVLKALKRDPAERYATVAALADDLQRHLDHRPVLAQPESVTYQISRFVRRNRVGVGAAAAVVLAVLGGAGVAAWQAAEARSGLARAEQARDFLVSMFDGINPDAAGPGRSVTASQVLDRAAARLPAGEPLRGDLLLALVRARLGLHEYAAVLALTEAAAAAAPGPDTPAGMLELRWARAQALKQLLKLEESERLLEPLLGPALRSMTPELRFRARVLQAEIATQRAQNEKARDLGLALLADLERAGPGLDAHLTSAHLVVGQSLSMLRDTRQGVKHSEAAHRLQQRLRPDEPTHPMRLRATQAYAAHLIELGRHDEAAPLLQGLLDDARAAYGEVNWFVPEFAARLAIVEAERGQFRRALALLDESVRASEAVGQPDTMAKAGILRTAGRAYMRERRYAAAVPLLDKSLAIVERAPTPYVSRVVRADRTYAAALAGSLPVGDAVAELQRIDAEQDVAEARFRTHLPVHYLGRLQGLNGETAQSLATLRKAEPMARANTRRIETAEALVDLALATLDAGAVPGAARAASLLDEAESMLRAAKAEALPAAADLALGRARVALARGDSATALSAAQRADAYWREAGIDGRDAGVAALWLARALAAAGQPEAARAARVRADRLLGTSTFVADARLRVSR